MLTWLGNCQRVLKSAPLMMSEKGLVWIFGYDESGEAHCKEGTGYLIIWD
jgi:hypothetical protein